MQHVIGTTFVTCVTGGLSRNKLYARDRGGRFSEALWVLARILIELATYVGSG